MTLAGKNCQTKQWFVEACTQVVESNCGRAGLKKNKQPTTLNVATQHFAVKLFCTVHNVRALKKTSVWNISVTVTDESLLFLQEKRRKYLFLGIMGFGCF